MNDIILKVDSISFRYGNYYVLKNISFCVNSDETFVILGPSGCGKSTLMKLCVGLYPHYLSLKNLSGSIELYNKNIYKISYNELNELRTKIGFVFQDNALISNLTVFQNVALPLKYNLSLTDKDTLRQIVKEKLEIVNIGEHLWNLHPATLSDGERKRVAIARAIVSQPKLIFFDDPGRGLDHINTSIIKNLIKKLKKEFGICTIISTHDMGLIYDIANKLGIILDGEMTFTGTVDELLCCDNTIIIDFLKPFLIDLAKKMDKQAIKWIKE